MMSELERELDEYLLGHRTLQDFEAWLASHARGILKSGDERAIELLNQLDADLVDIGEGLLDETAFRHQWNARQRFAATVTLAVEFTVRDHATVAATDAQTIRLERSDAPADRTVRFRHSFAA